ncbi:uncharacterized protein LOC133203219 [Saccostrea echinata]|uniref:uncharacterized protein LOC133203219 n=1 Tax=Saccostrea echinata TaxID=191078 RepID=UPI002A7FD44E|nr:uncharacterized protein LOC133203219 [Saccostrea echinata]
MNSRSLIIIGITCISMCFSGVSSECNMGEMSKCFEGFVMPNMESLSMQDLQTMCASVRGVKSCIEPYKSACAADSTFQSMMSGMTLAAGYCGDSGCNLLKCFSDAGINLDNTGGSSKKISCGGYMPLKNCEESQKKACQQNPAYADVQDSLKQAEKACGSPGGGISATPALWMVFSAAMMVLAAIFP